MHYSYTSRSQQDQIISAIKFFYTSVLEKKYSKINFDRPRKERPLPRIVDGSILRDKLKLISNIKHKAILSLAYDTGMRASEILNLKIEDCDKRRMRFRIRLSKRKKSREVPMSAPLRGILREYYVSVNPKEYLFNGQSSLQYSYPSLRKISNKLLGVNPHIIRHTYASELLRSGVDIRVIQKLLGHSSIKTTEIYTHVVSRDLDNIVSLLA